MTDNTHAQTPVPERYTGTVLPGGRGMELHGVPLSGSPDLVDEWDHGEDVEEHPDFVPTPDPIPVVVVHTGGHEFRRFKIARYKVNAISALTDIGQIVQVANRDPQRDRVTIQNLSQQGPLDRLWIAAARENCNPRDGYAVDPGHDLTIYAEDGVFASGDPGASGAIPIAVLTEYAVRES